MRILLAAAALALAAPLHAQAAGRRLPPCITEASATAGTELTRRGCAGTGRNEAVRISIALPTNWQMAFSDTADVVLTAVDGDNAVWVVGSDRLPTPLNRADTLAFWTRATELLLAEREEPATATDVEDFRGATGDRIASARDWLTGAQLADAALLALVSELSVSRDGRPVLHSETGVRVLAGEPAGYLSESLEQGGLRWRFTSYATVRDAALFIVSLNTLESEYAAMLPLFERMLASFHPRTERW